MEMKVSAISGANGNIKLFFDSPYVIPPGSNTTIRLNIGVKQPNNRMAVIVPSPKLIEFCPGVVINYAPVFGDSKEVIRFTLINTSDMQWYISHETIPWHFADIISTACFKSGFSMCQEDEINDGVGTSEEIPEDADNN